MGRPLGALRLLVVDDNQPMRSMMQAVFEGLGAQRVDQANSAEQAFEMIQLMTPDVVVTDWSMPLGGGLELLTRIRLDPACPDPLLPVLVLTGRTESRREARDAGANEFLLKPVGAADMAAGVLRAMAARRAFQLPLPLLMPRRVVPAE